jgi:hypothetical protein
MNSCAPPCHHAGDRYIVILQTPRHLKRLVGGDATTNDQQHATTIGGAI